MELTLDNTRRTDARTCLAMYYLRSKGLQKQQKSTALRYGSTWHGYMEGHYKAKMQGKDNFIDAAAEQGAKVWKRETEGKTYFDDYRTEINCGKAYIEYMAEFQDEGLIIKDVEKAFKIKMNPSSEEIDKYGLHSVDLYFSGMIDLQVEDYGTPWIWDHKSTGYPCKKIAFTQEKSPQMKGYTFATQCLNEVEAQGCIINIHQLASRKKKDGTYGKLTINFMRTPIIYSDTDIYNWRQSFLHTAGEIVRCMQTGIYPMDTNACTNYGQCAYLPICDSVRVEELPDIDYESFGEFILEPWDVLKKHPDRDIMYGEE